jgi:predicted dehydrogenase
MSGRGPRVGIFGLGVGLHAHLPALRAAGFDVVALGARRPEPLREASAATGIEALYTDLDELLEHPGLDAVSIATPPPTHHDLVVRAIGAGKHVLVEKAFAMSTAEAEEMCDAADAAGVTAMVAQAYRFAPSRTFVASLLESGCVGTPQQISISYFWETPPGMFDKSTPHWRWGAGTGGGLSTGHAQTLFDAAVTWFGPLTSIGGRVRTHDRGLVQLDGRPSDADDTFSATFETTSGVLGTIVASGAAPLGPGGRIEIYGDGGTIAVRQPMIVPTPADTVTVARLTDGGQPTELAIPEDFRLPDVGMGGPYQPFLRVAEAFRHGIESGTSPSPNFADSLHLQRISAALQESSRTGCFVDL